MRVRSRATGEDVDLPAGARVPSLFEALTVARERFVPGSADARSDRQFLGGWVDASALDALCAVARDLPSLQGWNEWAGVVPLAPNVADTAHFTPLEQCLQRNEEHLKQVFRKPRLQLKVEEERLPIAQARRVPESAVPTLIAHPEDWERRMSRSIRPLRVLSQRIEDEWDIYENRVAVRLVDRLLKALAPRIANLQRAMGLFEEGKGYQGHLQGWRWRDQRLYRLWGQVFRDDGAGRLLEETIDKLKLLHRALRTLQDSSLYRAVPVRSEVADTLRPTNILTNAPEYQKVAEVWRAWASSREPRLPPDVLRAQRREQSADFDRFVLLLVVVALSDLGWSPETNVPLQPGAQLLLRGRWGGLQFVTGTDGVVTLVAGDKALRIVPVLCGLEREHLGAIVRQLSAGARESTLILLFGHPDDVVPDSAASDLRCGQPTGTAMDTDVDLSFALTGWGRPAILMVSPYVLDSTERVARVVGSWLAQHGLPDYPASRPVVPDPGVPLPKWLRRLPNQPGHVAAIRPAAAQEVQRFKEQCESRRAQIQKEHQRTRAAKQQVDVGVFTAVDNLMAVAEHVSRLRALAACPVCGDADAPFEERLQGGASTWWCRCPRCESEWGTRCCGSCGRSYPVLVVKRPSTETPDRASTVHWIDREYGRDVWAEPCTHDAGGDEFRCGHCGACSSATVEGCRRCRPAGTACDPSAGAAKRRR